MFRQLPLLQYYMNYIDWYIYIWIHGTSDLLNLTTITGGLFLITPITETLYMKYIYSVFDNFYIVVLKEKRYVYKRP